MCDARAASPVRASARAHLAPAYALVRARTPRRAPGVCARAHPHPHSRRAPARPRAPPVMASPLRVTVAGWTTCRFFEKTRAALLGMAAILPHFSVEVVEHPARDAYKAWWAAYSAVRSGGGGGRVARARAACALRARARPAHALCAHTR